MTEKAAEPVPCDRNGCAPLVTGANCWNCPAIGVDMEITLTADQHAYAEALIAATTDTGTQPVTVEEYVQGIVERALTKPGDAGDGRSYG